MNRTVLALVLCSFPVTGCIFGWGQKPDDKLSRIEEQTDQSQIYYFRNGETCKKKADYTRFVKTGGALKIREIFEARGDFESRWENAKSFKPGFEEVDAVFFDICFEYGNERMTLAEYKEKRETYEKIRARILSISNASEGEIVPARNSVSSFSHKNMIQIHSGDFIMGSDPKEIDELVKKFQARYPQTQRWFFEDEAPRRKTNIGTIWMDKYEVTNAEFAELLSSPQGTSIEKPGTWDSRNSPPTKRLHPVRGVHKFQAEAFCKYHGKRLPTETEWEKAARGPDGKSYPWGEAFDSREVNTAELRRFDTTEVGSMKDDVSPYGIFDMGGNVMELVQNGYYPYPGNDTASGKAKESFEKRAGWAVARGGSFESPIYDSRGAGRRFFSPTHQGKDIGFRCAADSE